MNEKTDTWKIVYIPDKQPTPPNQQSIVNVFTSAIDTKLANALVRRLNQIAPLENLCHVKWIQNIHVEGGKTLLSVILCLASENDHQLSNLSQDVLELINSYHSINSRFANMLQHLEKSGKNNTSYGQHPPTSNIDGITGFTEEDSQSVFNFMKVAIKLAKSGDGSIVNAAVIVDPSV